jgi:P27 family predicted phage terminase small subunit
MRRTSLKQKLLKGTLRADRVRNEAQFAIADPNSVPSYLSKEARKEFRRVAPELAEQGILTQASMNILAAYSATYALWREALEDIASKGQVIMCESTTRTGRTVVPRQNPSIKTFLSLQSALLASARLFGIDPLSRQNIDANPLQSAPDKDDPLASLIGDGWGVIDNQWHTS